MHERIRALNGKQFGEQRIYCSEEYKSKCSIFGKSSLRLNSSEKTNFYSSSEYQTFRKFVLERDNHICQFCGEKAEHVHHERPQKLEVFFSLDPDYAWSCCKKCHYEKGHKIKTKCSLSSIRNSECR